MVSFFFWWLVPTPETGGILKEKLQLWHFKGRRQKRWHFKVLPLVEKKNPYFCTSVCMYVSVWLNLIFRSLKS